MQKYAVFYVVVTGYSCDFSNYIQELSTEKILDHLGAAKTGSGT